MRISAGWVKKPALVTVYGFAGNQDAIAANVFRETTLNKLGEKWLVYIVFRFIFFTVVKSATVS